MTSVFEEKQGALRNSITKQLNDSIATLNESQTTFKNEIITKLNDTTRAADEKFTQFIIFGPLKLRIRLNTSFIKLNHLMI
jgi:hypothetical protein